MSERTSRIRAVVQGVAAEAVRAAGAGGVVVLDDWTPEGELVYEWLVGRLGEDRVWRSASLASNVQYTGIEAAELQRLVARRTSEERSALIAHPANKTALLLGGRMPEADLCPLGDLWASQVETLASRWSAPPEVEALAAAAGGIRALDAALARLVDGRERLPAALDALPAVVGQRLLQLYDRGRFFRTRVPLVPKLGARTPGIDLFD